MRLTALQKVWEDWARADPLWAILSDPTKSHGRWDRDEFFSTGREEIAAVMRDLTERGISVRRSRCLDFGCGIGRLTQALTDFFDVCDGVDISPTMIREANSHNRHPDRCFFWLNDQTDLKIFPSNTFDFIYSTIVLQHIHPDISERYVREFMRLLTDDGIAVFQVPSKFIGLPAWEPLPHGSHLASVTLVGEVPALVAGQHSFFRFEVRNESPDPWPRGSRVKLGNHWRTPDGALLALDDGRTTLVDHLDPGAAVIVDLVTVPATAGSCVLEVDLVEEGICWFADRGSLPLRIPVSVAPASRRRRSLFAPRGAHRNDVPTAEPPLFAMHALPRDRVIATVEAEGGRLLDIESYNPSGEGWENYRYFVTTARTGAATTG